MLFQGCYSSALFFKDFGTVTQDFSNANIYKGENAVVNHCKCPDKVLCSSIVESSVLLIDTSLLPWNLLNAAKQCADGPFGFDCTLGGRFVCFQWTCDTAKFAARKLLFI